MQLEEIFKENKYNFSELLSAKPAELLNLGLKKTSDNIYTFKSEIFESSYIRIDYGINHLIVFDSRFNESSEYFMRIIKMLYEYLDIEIDFDLGQVISKSDNDFKNFRERVINDRFELFININMNEIGLRISITQN